MDDANRWIHSNLHPWMFELGVCSSFSPSSRNPDMKTRMGQTLRRRLPPTNSKGGLLNLRAFKSAPFTFYCLSAFFAFLGLYTGKLPQLPNCRNSSDGPC